ncbi:MAG TPA: HD domain-containing phosphohydrolase [Thermoleophilaceae bacterium]|nr:HD domain-containing phosphohydrolase [Thermoleophilaceae bacterium]
MLTLLWLHALGLTIFALGQGFGVAHSLQEGAMVGIFAAAATMAGSRKRTASALVSLGLITASAVLVHLWGGVIEAHFHFFVMIVILSLYEDWVPFLLAAAYVVLHHGLVGALDADSVYNHAQAVAHPWRWAAIHGLFVTSAGAGAVLAWRLNEEVRAETDEAYQQARHSEERFRSAFENAPIGMALASIRLGEFGRYLQVNPAMAALTGYSREELLTMSGPDITHPEDVAAGIDVSRRMLAGELTAATLDKRYVHADGRILSALVNISLVRDAAGEPIHTVVQVQDVTEQKRIEAQLSHQAYHDSLTGLPNRRKLMRDLEERLTAGPTAPTLLILFDLDGFKAYNDAYGHPAGDALLVRLGARLEAAIHGRGNAYRMGGDEFCVLADLMADGPAALAAAGSAALTECGEGFDITASHGVASIPHEASTAAEALGIADQRMYARKGQRRTSAGRQATDALLRALAERNPGLGEHLDDVTGLCEAVGRELGLPDEQMTPLLQAAALHDVGKVAIPDAILDKPGPLDEHEWEFMRKHTLIGERILAEAPSLAAAAKIVRSSHERYDGGGYPDGLAGDEIPLAARIVSVCDSFDAMTSNRPYRTGMSTEGALSELTGCAGSQFDPAVVAAFERALQASLVRT